MLSDGTYNYEYDAEGNRTKKTVIATGEATEYHWDHRNRLVQVVHVDSNGSPTQTLNYKYDVFDRRIGKSDTPAVGPAYTEDYVYDGEHLALKFEAGQLANRYLHGPVIDQILADEQVASLTSPGEVLWPLTDNLGTVRDLASHDAATAITTIANHLSYDAFGGVTAETNTAVDHLFGYTGREWDAEANLQYNRARWYDPAAGTWISPDPIGFAAGDANLYRYVENQPTTVTDPSGLTPPPENYPYEWDSPQERDPYGLFPPLPPPLPPSGPVTEPGALDPEEYVEDLLEDWLEEQAEEHILDPFKDDLWDPWWEEHNPLRDPDDDPLAPPSDGPPRPRQDPWWERFKPDRWKVRPKHDRIELKLYWYVDDSCPDRGPA